MTRQGNSEQDMAGSSMMSMAAKVASGEVTSQKLVEDALARAERCKAFNFFTELNADNALRQAKAIDQQRSGGEKLGRLAGVPLVIKDNIDTKDLSTTAGSSAFAGWRPSTDAPIVAALRAQGAVILAKANMHELAFGVTSNNRVYGPVRNPYDKQMIAGGSSGGTAAAIAAGVVAGGLGTDTGGSVRMPAALCGCVGFRPSDGRYSGEGIIPLSWTRDAPGPMAKTVADAELLDKVCSRVPDTASGISSLSGLRIGIPQRHFRDVLDPDVAAAFDEMLAKLRAAGAELVAADLADVAALLENTRSIVKFETPRALSGYMAGHGLNRGVLEVLKAVKGDPEREFLVSTVMDGTRVEASDYIESLMINRPQLQKAYADYFAENGIAAFAVPATIRPASKIGEDDFVEVNGKRMPTFPAFTHNTSSTSAAGVPCLTLPIALSGTGLPIGADIVGPARHDTDVFAIARLVEAQLPQLPPPA